jgi:5'-deoxynucleotidase YfbR-like HD superfamily hydrolase
MKDRINFLLAGANVRRYHTVNTIATETVGHHSHQVAALVFLLDEHPSVDLVYSALTHDLAEHVTGDVPAPSKREFGISDQFNRLEEKLLQSSGWNGNTLDPQDARTLKLADIAQGALFCVEEMQRGNRLMKVVFDRYIGYAESMVLCGAEKVLFSTIKEMSNER